MISPAKSPAFEWIEVLRLTLTLHAALANEEPRLLEDDQTVSDLAVRLLADLGETTPDDEPRHLAFTQMLFAYFDAIGGPRLFSRVPVDQPVLAAVYLVSALHGFRFPVPIPPALVHQMAAVLMSHSLPLAASGPSTNQS